MDDSARLHVAWVGTRLPYPPSDGGRQVAWLTIRALADAGARVTVVTPAAGDVPDVAGVTFAPVRQSARPWPLATVHAAASRRPLTIARHAMPAVAARLAEVLARGDVDVVHVEQLQALLAARTAISSDSPIVLRAHNVESDVWAQGGDRATWLQPIVRLEARRLRAYEAEALRRVATTITLTDTDADTLRRLTPGADVRHLPPPAPSATQPGPPLAGEPACVWIGSPGWPPNDDGLRWLRTDVWPAIAARVPGARLHVFAPTQPDWPSTVTRHGAPGASGEAFARGAVLLLPLRLRAGVRMRALEAWASGVPIVGSAAALDGLDATPDVHALVAHTPGDFAEAVARLHRSPEVRAQLVEAGLARVRNRHSPATVANATLDVYRDAIAHHAAR